MLPMSAAPFPWGLLYAGHALLELVLVVFISFTVLLGLFPSLH
jgi:hypothetical protein